MKHRKVPTVNQLIGKLKGGYEFLSQIQRLPPSPCNFVATVLGVGMGVAGLFMALQNSKISHFGIPWVSQQKDSSEKIYYVGGLQNLGNNCFLNVILQALASCSSFLPFLQNVLETDVLNEEEVERMPLIVALCSLLEGQMRLKMIYSNSTSFGLFGLAVRSAILTRKNTTGFFIKIFQTTSSIAEIEVSNADTAFGRENLMRALGQFSLKSFGFSKLLLQIREAALDELCIIHDERTVLNPRKVMRALSVYTNNFNLTRQQDASEAFLHLLSSLKNESSRNYVPHSCSLANITSSSRIYNQKSGDQHEFERWRQILFGPFDGTIGSILTCRSCSSMLSVDFESFHCLPLSPVLDRSENIIDGCTLTDCLKHFTAVEHLESYHCSQCWHIAAIKHLSLKSEKDEGKINKLSICVDHDSCSCRDLFHKEEITWSGFSHASKQLVITCYPQILCIYIQRASMNISGEFVKRQGHISFPLFLDLSPFMAVSSTLVQETSVENMRIQWTGRQQEFAPQQSQINKQLTMQMLPPIFRIIEQTASVEALSRNNSEKSTNHSESYSYVKYNLGISKEEAVQESKVVSSGLDLPFVCSVEEAGSCEKENASETGNACSSKSCMYRLSSVVEHYGRYGGGHYAAYRRAMSDSLAEPIEGNWLWFYTSDREVSQVSEETVLAAEATLLFYERI